MQRVWILGAVTVAAVGCRHYDYYRPLADQDGLLPASQYARFGTEQAQAMAIARSLGQWHGRDTPEDRAVMVSKAAQYATTLPGVASVVPDTMGYRLSVTFKSGWHTFVLPVNDGVKPEDTSSKPK